MCSSAVMRRNSLTTHFTGNKLVSILSSIKTHSKENRSDERSCLCLFMKQISQRSNPQTTYEYLIAILYL